MTLSFQLGTALQADQTSGVDGAPDTDLAYTDTLFSSLKTAVAGTTYVADTTYAADVAGAYSASAMTVTGTGTVADIKFVDSTGGALDGDDSGLNTADGYDILLYAGSDSIVYGVYTVDGIQYLAFATQMVTTYSGTTATISLRTITYAPIEQTDTTSGDETVNLGNNLQISASESTGFDFSALASSNFLYGVVGSSSGGFLVIGKDPAINPDGTPVNGNGSGDLINTSKGGGEITIGVNNQQFNGDTKVQEGAYFTYITGLNAGTYNDADGIVPTGYIESESGKLQISQVQGGGTQTMRITTLDYNGSTDGKDFVADLTDTNHGTEVELVSIPSTA